MPTELTTPTTPPNTDPNVQGKQQAAQTPESFEKWIDAQDETVKGLYESHITGLRNTVQATRQERDTLAKQIKEVSAKAEKGSELEKSLTEFSQKLEAAERKSAFLEAATQPGIDCRNPKAAYALAQSENLFTRAGAPDWAALKAMAPELFGKPHVPGNGGEGTQTPPTKADMNAYIRQQAGG